MDKKTWILLGVGSLLAYVLYTKLTGAAKAASAALTATGEAIGGSIYELFNPYDSTAQDSWIVNFSNGRHSIPKNAVDSTGHFTYNGAKFVMKVKVLPDGSRENWAFAP